MEHSAAKTKAYIDEANAKFARVTDPADRDLMVFAYLRGRRRRGDEPLLKKLNIGAVPDDPKAPFDVDLADAEHYAYARLLAGTTGDPSVKALVTGY